MHVRGCVSYHCAVQLSTVGPSRHCADWWTSKQIVPRRVLYIPIVQCKLKLAAAYSRCAAKILDEVSTSCVCVPGVLPGGLIRLPPGVVAITTLPPGVVAIATLPPGVVAIATLPPGVVIMRGSISASDEYLCRGMGTG